MSKLKDIMDEVENKTQKIIDSDFASDEEKAVASIINEQVYNSKQILLNNSDIDENCEEGIGKEVYIEFQGLLSSLEEGLGEKE